MTHQDHGNDGHILDVLPEPAVRREAQQVYAAVHVECDTEELHTRRVLAAAEL